MRFLKGFAIIGALMLSFLANAWKEDSLNESCLLDENDSISLGEQTVDYLNGWCSDAWCAGD